jgi:hypothetical protein
MENLEYIYYIIISVSLIISIIMSLITFIIKLKKGDSDAYTEFYNSMLSYLENAKTIYKDVDSTDNDKSTLIIDYVLKALKITIESANKTFDSEYWTTKIKELLNSEKTSTQMEDNENNKNNGADSTQKGD